MGLLRQGRDRRCTAIAIPSRLRLSRRPAMGRSSETGWLASHLWQGARLALYARRRRTGAGCRRPTPPPDRGQVLSEAGCQESVVLGKRVWIRDALGGRLAGYKNTNKCVDDDV